MPANLKLSAKPSPSPTVQHVPSSKSTAHPFPGDCDDDDDFEPPHARPLKPFNGAGALRHRKKLKPSSFSSSGKENGSAASGAAGAAATAAKAAETLGAGSRASGGVPKAKKLKTGEICGLLRYGSDSAKLACKVKMGLDRYGYCNGSSSSLPNLIESRVLAPGADCDLGVGRCEEAQLVGSRYCTSVSEGNDTDEVAGSQYDPPKLEKKLSSSGAIEGHHQSRLIEPVHLESDASCEFVIAGSYDSDGHGSVILGPFTEKQNMEKASGVASQCGSGLHTRNHQLDSLESELLMSNAKYGPRGCDCNEIQDPGLGACNLIPQQRKVAAEAERCAFATHGNVTLENKSIAPEACKGQCCADSSVSELLESHMTLDFDADCYDNFEIGTQLSELINLCMEDSIEGQSNCSASPMEKKTFDSKRFKSDYDVKCPLCGLDISDLSEELRQLHTNNCLDEPAKKSSLNHEKEPCAGESVEIRRVVEWLRNLGLSKYEEVFIREEVDWETLQWLTEEDLQGMGITSLGPRKKIIHALGELRKKHDDANETEDVVLNSENTKKTKLPMNGNKLITQYFQCSSSDKKQRRVSKVKTPNLNEQKTTKIPTRRTCAGKGKIKDTPLWCCIPGTPFRVDAFRYLRGDCSHWFLTHFHVDHYQGLTRSFCHGKIYCSSITAGLVHHKIGIPWDSLHVLPLNEKINIAGVNLTCFDANHCPGSMIILFEPPNGKAVLHTGDFRFSSAMVNNPILQSSHIHTLILDTTYCNPRYDFPSQEIVIQFVIEAIQAEAFNPKTLFLIGSYTIGKEKLFMEVARLLQKKIYVGAAKLQILKHLELPQEVMHWFTANEAESHIHVVPMWTLASFKRMKYLSNQYAGRFDLIVAFCPTGWAFGKGRKRTPGKRWQQGSIIRYEVPYSEHSSFTELQEFVKFISPEHIIPSVNNDGPESADAMLAQLLNE